MPDNYRNFPNRSPSYFPNARTAMGVGGRNVKRLFNEGNIAGGLGEIVNTGLGTIGGLGVDVINTGLAVTDPPARFLEQIFTGQSPPRDRSGLGIGGDAGFARDAARRSAIALTPPAVEGVVPPVAPAAGGEGVAGGPGAPGGPALEGELLPPRINPADFNRLYGDQIATGPDNYVRPTAAQNAARNEVLANQRARPMPKTIYRDSGAPANPLEGIGLPRLSGNVGINDLINFRLGLINAGSQLIPRVGAAAAAATQEEQLNADRALALKGLELGQADRIAQSRANESALDRQARIQAAQIRAQGDPATFDELMREFDAGRAFEEFAPVSGATPTGDTVAGSSRELADIYGPELVFRISRQMQEEAAQTGEVDLSTPENTQMYIQELTTRLNQAVPGRLAIRP